MDEYDNNDNSRGSKDSLQVVSTLTEGPSLANRRLRTMAIDTDQV